MANFPKKTLAIFSLTCCEGCQFELLSFYDHFEKLLKFYDIKNFRLGQEINVGGPYDVVLIEGNPDSEIQEDLLRKVRKESKTLIAIGSCAHLGGIQSERDRLPEKILGKKQRKTYTVDDIVKVDYVVPGCPVSHNELIKCLLEIYWDNKFVLPDYAVCFECRQNENKCLIKNGKPCLGPITTGGCNSICINGGEACLGCRGPLEQANFEKMRQVLTPLLDKAEIENWLTLYGDYEKQHKKEQRK